MIVDNNHYIVFGGEGANYDIPIFCFHVAGEDHRFEIGHSVYGSRTVTIHDT